VFGFKPAFTDEGQGWPYYKLTPFDELGDSISFGNIDPCPAGCLGTGGRVSGKINFYEQKSRSEISAKFIKDNNNIATCSEVIIGKNLYGDFCSPDDEVTFGSKALIVEGKNYSYEIIGLGCDDYFIGKYPNLATQTKCESIIDSIKVE